MRKLRSLLKKDSGKLAKKSGITFIIKISGMAAGYLLTLLVTKNGGSEAWGNYALAYAVLQICSTLAQLGVDTASIRFVSQFHSAGDNGKLKDFYLKALSIVLVSSIVISIALYFLSPYIGKHIFDKEYLIRYIQLAALGIVPQTMIDLHAEMFKGLKKPGIFAFFMYVSTYLFACVLVAISVFAMGGSTAIDGWIAMKDTVIGLWIIVLIIIVLWHTKVKLYNHSGIHSLPQKEILRISAPMMITMSIVLIMGWTDTLMLGALMENTDSVGVYNVALKLSTTIGLALMAVNSVSTPRYAEFFGKNEMEKLNTVIRQSTKLVFWLSLPMCLICIVVPGWVLSFFGNDFRAGAISLVLLSIGRFISSACGSVGYILQMTGHEKTIQNIMVFACILNILLNYIFIPRYGINGSAFATMLSTITWNITAVFFIRKKLNLTTVYLPYILNK